MELLLVKTDLSGIIDEPYTASPSVVTFGKVTSVGENLETALMRAVGGSLSLEKYRGLSKIEVAEKLESEKDERIFIVFEALRREISVEYINEKTGTAVWFLERLKGMADLERELKNKVLSEDMYKRAKAFGYHDIIIEELSGSLIGTAEPGGMGAVLKRLNIRLAREGKSGTYFYMDVVSDGKQIFIPGVVEKIEEGHLVYPAFTTNDITIREMKKIAKKIALESGIVGLLSIKYLVVKDKAYVADVKEGAVVDFISDSTKLDIIGLAKETVATGKLSKTGLAEPLGYTVAKLGDKVSEGTSINKILNDLDLPYDDSYAYGDRPVEVGYYLMESNGIKMVCAEHPFAFDVAKTFGADFVLHIEDDETIQVFNIFAEKVKPAPVMLAGIARFLVDAEDIKKNTFAFNVDDVEYVAELSLLYGEISNITIYYNNDYLGTHQVKLLSRGVCYC